MMCELSASGVTLHFSGVIKNKMSVYILVEVKHFSSNLGLSCVTLTKYFLKTD